MHSDFRKIKKDLQNAEKKIGWFVDQIDNEKVDAVWEIRNDEGLRKMVDVAVGAYEKSQGKGGGRRRRRKGKRSRCKRFS